MLGLGEPCSKKAKCDQQRIYNDRRKEKPRKPQFSLNFQFGEEEEMRSTNERFVRLRNMADLKSGRTNADFLIALMDRYEGKNGPNNKEMHSVEVQANATESVFELYAQREAKKNDFECQWPCGEAPSCKAIPLFFFRFLSNAFSDFGSVGRKRKKKNKNKIEKKSGARWPGTSA